MQFTPAPPQSTTSWIRLFWADFSRRHRCPTNPFTKRLSGYSNVIFTDWETCSDPPAPLRFAGQVWACRRVRLTGPVVTTQYYYAGGQRVALRKNGVLHYLLGDHPSPSSGQVWAAQPSQPTAAAANTASCAIKRGVRRGSPPAARPPNAALQARPLTQPQSILAILPNDRGSHAVRRCREDFGWQIAADLYNGAVYSQREYTSYE